VGRDPEERREVTRRPGDSEASEGGEEGRRGQQIPPALETSREPSEATSIREEPFPHGEERPQDGLERSWWRRIFRGPHEAPSQRPWWRRVFGGG